MLAKQPLQFVFGATDQDTSKKGVKPGDLIKAYNVQQVKAGEHSKRDGFTASAQTYEGLASIVGESLCSPDGIQVMTRDATTDTVFARSTDATHNKAMGASLRYLCQSEIRFPALETGKQITPMAKQAGDFYVYLTDESTFVVAKRSPNGETMLISRTVAVSAGSPASTHVKSFAVIDNATFDPTSVWVFWVDWSTNGTQQNRDAIRAFKFDHTTLAPTFYALETGTATNRCYTSVCASVTDDGLVTVAATLAHVMDGSDATFYGFRSDAVLVDVGLAVNKYNAIPSMQFSSEYSRTATGGGWTASGICALTTAGIHSHHAGHCRFSFWAANPDDSEKADLVVVDVNESTAAQTWTVLETVDNVGHTDENPYFMGSTTGHETATGSIVAAQMRIYYRGATAGTWVDPSDDIELYPDRIWTRIYECSDSTGPHVVATLRGAWLAHGYFTADDGTDVIITGWQDGGGVQRPYHLRRLDTGAILSQFAYGEGAFAGGCANTGTQIAAHACDVNQPVAQGVAGVAKAMLAIQSANIAGSADVAEVALSKPTYQDPAAFRDFAIYPGPIPTIANGWQKLQEAGPLVYPSQLKSFWGVGSSPIYADSITTGDAGAAIVYRLTDASGVIWRSAPQLLANAVEWAGTPARQWIVIPTLRHLLPGTTAQIEIYLGQVDLQLFRVIANDPIHDYIEFCPQSNVDGTYPTPMITIEQAVANAQEIGGVGEVLYTTGGAIPNDPPPQMRGLSIWRNRVIGWFGNRIWVSQEFADGLGIQWTSYTALQWGEGTGDILGGCMIDWSYFAVFKRDAIAIIDGQGPDGMGHGNYVIRTLTTKAGCVNPKSLVNGADGCYYQDSQTNRLMLLTPDLQTREAMPGAFDLWQAGAQIQEALHVEARRQVWFVVSGSIEVLDYKHRTEKSSMGQAYKWPTSGVFGGGAGGLFTGTAIVGGSPLLLISDGKTATQVANQYYDLASDGTTKTAVLQSIETGELQAFGIQGMGDIQRVMFLGEFVSAHALLVTTFPQFQTTGDAITATISTAPEQITLRPPHCQRVQSMRLRVEEVSVTSGSPAVPVYGAGFKFFGFALVVQPRGRLQDLDVGRIY